MKHVLTSAGLLALGAVSLHAQDPEMSRQASGRPFTLGASVRGFYDDNVNTSPDKVVTAAGVTHPRHGSFGIQFSPSAHLTLPYEQTVLTLGYVYSLNWYEDRGNNDIDQSHEFSGKFTHQFSPRHDIAVDDSFVLTSEPTIAERFGIITSPVRVNTRTRADVLHNTGSIADNFSLTRLVGLGFGYVNSWYDYEQTGAGSRSALLDRIEHLIRADLHVNFNPRLVGVLGYTFGLNTYTGDDFLSATLTGPKSSIRDSYSHYAYIGADYDITARLRSTVRVGGQITDYHEVGDSSINPYADASLSYAYLTGCSIEVGVRHSRNATDVGEVATTGAHVGRPTLDAETTAVYAQLSHRITRSLTGTANFQWQNSSFNFGGNNGKSDELYLVGGNLQWQIDHHWSAEVGYSYDQLNTDLADRGYDRNRYYVGIHATY